MEQLRIRNFNGNNYKKSQFPSTHTLPDAKVSGSSNHWLYDPETFVLPVSLTQITKLESKIEKVWRNKIPTALQPSPRWHAPSLGRHTHSWKTHRRVRAIFQAGHAIFFALVREKHALISVLASGALALIQKFVFWHIAIKLLSEQFLHIPCTSC